MSRPIWQKTSVILGLLALLWGALPYFCQTACAQDNLPRIQNHCCCGPQTPQTSAEKFTAECACGIGPETLPGSQALLTAQTAAPAASALLAELSIFSGTPPHSQFLSDSPDHCVHQPSFIRFQSLLL